MKQYLIRCCISLSLLTCILLSLTLSINLAMAATAPHPIKHSSIQKVELQIIQGRIFFHPNTVSCSHLSRVCFEFVYSGGNYGPRPLWLDHNLKIVLTHGQILPQSFNTISTHFYYLFQFSQWWKVQVHVV